MKSPQLQNLLNQKKTTARQNKLETLTRINRLPIREQIQIENEFPILRVHMGLLQQPDLLQAEKSLNTEYPQSKSNLPEKHLRPNDYEIPRHGSMTIPDQSMTIPEIQARFASGLPYTAGRVPVYEGKRTYYSME